MNFTGTTGSLTNLYGAVTYRIQVVVVGTLNGQEVIGDRSAAIEMTTFVDGKQICAYTYVCTYISTSCM